MGKVALKPRRQFTVELKLRVVQLAQKNTKGFAARLFNITPRQVKRWCTEEEQIRSAVHSRKWRNGRGNSLTAVDVGQSVNDWLVDQAKMESKTPEICKPEPCLIPWSKRYKVTLPTQEAKVAQGNNSSISWPLNEDIDNFHKKIRSVQSTNDYRPSDVGIINELTVPVLNKVSAESKLTVVLSALADGAKLPPLVIIKGEDLPSTLRVPPSGVHILVSRTGLFGEPEVLWWLKHIWLSARVHDELTLKSLPPARRLLVSCLHNRPSIDNLERLADTHCHTDVVQIPAESNEALVNLIETLCRVFQTAFETECCRWMSSKHREKDMTPCQLELQWVKSAWWDGVGSDSVVEVFQLSDVVGDDMYMGDNNTTMSNHMSARNPGNTTCNFLGFTQQDIDRAKDIMKRQDDEVVLESKLIATANTKNKK